MLQITARPLFLLLFLLFHPISACELGLFSIANYPNLTNIYLTANEVHESARVFVHSQATIRQSVVLD